MPQGVPDYVNEAAHMDIEDCGRVPGHFLQQKCSSKFMVLMNLFIFVSRLQPCYCPQNLQIRRIEEALTAQMTVGWHETEKRHFTTTPDVHQSLLLILVQALRDREEFPQHCRLQEFFTRATETSLHSEQLSMAAILEERPSCVGFGHLYFPAQTSGRTWAHENHELRQG